MNRKTIALLMATLVAGVLVGAILAHVAGRPGVAGSAVPESIPAAPVATVADGITFSGSSEPPATTPDLLPSGLPAVHGFFHLSGMKSQTTPQITWSRNGKAIGRVAAEDMTVDPAHAGSGRFVLRPTSGKLASGIYEVELTAAGRRFRASFVAAEQAGAILAQKAPASATLQVTQHVIARGVGQHGEPKQPAARLRSGDRVFYVLRYEGAEPGMALSVRWWRDNIEIVSARKDVILSSEAGWAHAWIQAEGGLPAGTYSVTASVAGGAGEITRDQFTVN